VLRLERGDRPGLLNGGCGGPADGRRLARDLGHEYVRKVS
jgi:hypothetical protein